MTLAGIAENLVADVIFLLIPIGLGLIVFFLTRRAKLLKFFGIASSRRIAIYLSNLRVTPGGAIGINGRRLSYQGSAAAFGEMLIANRFRDLFNYLIPSLSEAPSILSKLLISDVQVELLSSPLDYRQIERSSSLVALGGPAYNLAADFIEAKLHSQARFRFGQATASKEDLTTGSSDDESSPTSTVVTSTSSSTVRSTVGSPSTSVPSSVTCLPMEEPDSHPDPTQAQSAILVEGIPPITDTTFGFVERLVDPEQERSVFYAAGLSELGTVGAAHFLATEWARLYRKYGNSTSFVVMLRIEPADFRRWTIVFER
jgi:hypothetical protein